MPIATISSPIPLPLTYSYLERYSLAQMPLFTTPTVGCYPIYLCFEAYER